MGQIQSRRACERKVDGGSVGRAFWEKVVDTISGSSWSRRWGAIDGRGLCVEVAVGVVDAVGVVEEGPEAAKQLGVKRERGKI